MNIRDSLLLKAACNKQTERTPVWLMRQAGRILPEYRKVRASVSGFKELVKTPELACEVTLQPVNLLGVDAAIIFSDILVVPEAMGLNYEMVESIGPIFDKTIDTTKDIDNIHVANLEDLEYVTNAIKLTRAELNNELPLIGFAGAPWTIFSYMLEGKGSKTFSKARSFLYCEPVASHLLLDKITDSTISYLKSQIKAGANIVQIFDSWAGILGPEQYKDFGIKYLKKICDAINDVPIIVFAKGANNSIDKLSNLNCEVLGLDWQVKIEDAQNWAPSKALQGNLDPTVLYADKNTIINHTKSMLQKFGNKGHIANLGHGVYPDTPLDGVKCFIDTVKGYNGPY